MNEQPINVVLVDDHEIVRNGLATLFDRAGMMRVIGQAGSVSEIRTLSVPTTPDIVLLDLYLGDGDGLGAVQETRDRWGSAKVVILSGFTDPLARRRALEMGVDGYILKELNGAAIVEALRQVLSGEQVYYDSEIAARASVHGSAFGMSYKSLGPREREVLEAIGEGKLNKEIAAELDIAEKSVRNIITGLFRKLNVGNRTEAAIMYARLRGGKAGSG